MKRRYISNISSEHSLRMRLMKDTKEGRKSVQDKKFEGEGVMGGTE